MISIRPLTLLSPEESRSAPGKESENTQAKGRWVGEGATLLNLQGTVEERQFLRVLDGLSPDGHVRLVKDALREERTLAWQIKIEAPKSVSTLWSEAPAKYQESIRKMHEFAASCVFEHLEKKLGNSSEPDKGKVRLVGALFENQEAKDGGNLRSDLVLMNLGMRLDGPNREFSDRSVIKEAWPLTDLYQRRFQDALKERLGLEFEKGASEPRIQGVPQGSEKEGLGAKNRENSSFWKKCSEFLSPKSAGYRWDAKAARELIAHGLSRKRLRERLEELEKRKEQRSQQKTAAKPTQSQESAAKTTSKTSTQTQSH